MLRRYYFLFPQRKDVEEAVTELHHIGVSQQNLHTIAKEGVNIQGLPVATVRQKTDFGAYLEEVIWNLNLIVFFIALIVLFAALFVSNLMAMVISLVIMTITFTAGTYFASHIPHTHLNECQNEINHGEILLLVDVPHHKLTKVESYIRHRHPEMIVGGVTWTLPGL